MHLILIPIGILIYQRVEANEYRLPETVLPKNYDIVIQLNADAFVTDKFKGEINITLEIVNQTRVIEIHAKNLTGIHFDLISGNRTHNISNSNYISDPVTDIINITSKDLLNPGEYYLFGTYDGILDRHNPHGLYKSTYENNGHREYMANTEMALTSARKVFPCFDEPGFKATFNLTVIYPKGYNVLANALPSGNAREKSNTLDVINFEKTPKMSTYLVAFVVSNFTCSSVSGDILYRVCSRPSSKDQRQYALEILQKTVEYFGNFTGISYNVSRLGKLDLVALPHLQETAMENWGLVCFTEKSLLYDDDSSSNRVKQTIATLIYHEIAHMWFGNLVTPKWWGDIFLNEGLAAYFEYFGTAEIEKDWELDKQFIVDQLQTALRVDTSIASLPLSSNVDSPRAIWGRFDAISYYKGASVVRMIANAIGLDNFQKGIRKYLQDNEFGNTVAADFWSSLATFSQLEHNLSQIAHNWTYQAGYPLLNVRTNGTNITITQERFLFSDTSDTKWYVPITYTTSRNTKKFLNTSTKLWLTPDQNEAILENKIIDKSDWIILNNLQTGYYRVNYDEGLWNRIEQVLIKNPNDIYMINRAQIIDDLFNFVKAGEISYSIVLKRILFLKNDTDYYPWQVAFRELGPILAKSTGLVRTKLENFILMLMDKLYESVPFVVIDFSNHIYSLKQTLAIDWACKVKHAGCVRNSRKIFEAYKHGLRPNKNLFLPTCCTSVKHSDNIEADWNFLWEKYKDSNVANERKEILQALSCTSNHTILGMFLHWSIDESLIEKQNSLIVWVSVLMGTPEGVNATLEFFTRNYKEIENYYKNENILKFLTASLVAVPLEQSQINKLEDFSKSQVASQEMKSILHAALIVAKNNLVDQNLLKSDLEQYFNITRKSASTRLDGNVYLFCILLFISYITF